MKSWFDYFKKGVSRKPLKDRIGDKKPYTGLKANLKNLRPFVVRHWKKGLLGACLIIFTTLLGLPVPLITRYLIDNVILAKQINLLLGVVIVLALIKIMGIAAGALQQFYFARFEQEVLLDIQHDLLDRTLRFPKAFFDKKETGYLMSRLLGDVGGLRFFFSSTLVHIGTSILRLVGGIVLLIYLKWQLALVVLIALPVMVFLVRFFAGKMRILSHHSMEQRAQVSRVMQESLSSTSLIKSFSTEKRTVSQVVSNLKKTMNLGLEQITMSSAAGISIGLVPEIARVIVLLAGAYWVIIGDWTLGSLLAFRSYVRFVYGPAQFLSSVNINFQTALAALERVSALFNIVPEENLENGKKVKRLKGEIEFKNVSFSYNQRDTVLDDVSFFIPAGGQIAIVGPSGVGKTTILSLLLCFYKPKNGEILFDGLPVSEYNLSHLRQHIGYVSQKPLLLSGTIMENLCYGNPRADESQVVKMSKVAGIHNFIMGLPDGYHSKVGERGVNLSEGQIQRIALGRALLKNPDIFILDEPASALDALTEQSIFKALPALVKNKTLFIVAHRKSTIQKAKQILLLNERRLVGIGTHQELLKNSAYYRSLLSSQQIPE